MSVVFPIEEDPRFRLSTAVGGETSYSVPFPFQANADIALVRYSVDGSEIPQLEGMHYSLTGAGNPAGGTAELVTPMVAGEKMLRVGRAVLDRVTSIVRSGKFSSAAVDADLDRWILIAQELARDRDRSIKMPLGSTVAEMPPPAPSKFWRWSDDGQRIQFVDILTAGTLVITNFGQQLVAEANAGLARLRLGLGALATLSTVDLTLLTADTKRDLRMVADPGRASSVVYHGVTSVRLEGRRDYVLNGFFFNGHYERSRGRAVDAPARTDDAYHVVDIGNGTSTPGALAYQSWAQPNVWYNVFACANADDTVAVHKVTPSLRVGSIAGSVVTLNNCGENSYSVAAKSFEFATNGLAGRKCLVVTETLTGRPTSWSGRIATITANTKTTITLDVIGGLAQGDYIIPAPPYDEYKWLGDFYWEAASPGEVRNISSDGRDARAYMVTLQNGFPAAGVSVTGNTQRVLYSGNVSPLARRALCQVTITMSAGYAAGTGYAEDYDMDGGNHTPARVYTQNQINGIWAFTQSQVWVEGSYGPYFYFKNQGTPAAVTNHIMLVVGWQY